MLSGDTKGRMGGKEAVGYNMGRC